MTTAAIIVAAGRGLRAGGAAPKQWQMLAGRAVVAHALAAFAGLDRRVLVIHPDDHARAAPYADQAMIVAGGATRDASVRAALLALQGSGVTRVLIHDAARPLISAAVIARVLDALQSHDAAAPALAVTDALWHGAADQVTGTHPRDGLFRAQTPQGFTFAKILKAQLARQTQDLSSGAADDVEVARAAGMNVAIVPGDEDNLKLTYAGDFARAEAILKGQQMDIRCGNGFDVHAFCPGDHLWLCGVKIAHERGLLGHSDADVGMHALTDAIYGALAEGDIGQHFAPTEAQWRGAQSHIFLTHAAQRAAARGFRISHADVTLICERPRIGPHAAAMRARLAAIIGIDADRISVKATTSEGLGFTGREEGIAAMATATLVTR